MSEKKKDFLIIYEFPKINFLKNKVKKAAWIETDFFNY